VTNKLVRMKKELLVVA